MSQAAETELLQRVWDYPLFAALYGRRSRRFGLGFEIAEGPFPYRSRHAALPLDEFEEALLVAAGTGVSGVPLWDGSRPPAVRRGATGRSPGSPPPPASPRSPSASPSPRPATSRERSASRPPEMATPL